MRIKLLHDIPVDLKHNMVEGRILEVLRVQEKELGVRGTEKGFWVQGKGEEVKIWERECVETNEEISKKRYLVTDPCYIVPREEWHKYLDETGFGNSVGDGYKIEGKGVIIDSQGTSYGDGTWNVGGGKQIMADAGLVCIVELVAGYQPTNYEGNAITDSKDEATHWFDFVIMSDESDIRMWER